MRLSHFFIDRPIFAAVVSIVFVIVGAVSVGRLPVAQYPEIAPPVVRVSGQYPGASADVVADTVVAPLEQQINGVENMIYMTSNSTGDGRFQIDVTLELGTNLDIAQVQVQNRVAIAQPRIPTDVRNIGVTTAKSSPDLMMVVHLYSPDKSRDPLFISNYATVEVTDLLNRIYGVGAITVFGARDYSMRVWLDPDRLYALGLTTGDVVTALQGQNVQVASGVLNQPPVAQPRAFQIAVRTLGRLVDPKEFAEIVIKNVNGFPVNTLRRNAAKGVRCSAATWAMTGQEPNRASTVPSNASSTASTMSAQHISPKPPASASPFTAATTGVRSSGKRAKSSTTASAKSCTVPDAMSSGRSAPPQKTPSDPVRTMARTSSAASSSASVAWRALVNRRSSLC